MADATLLLFSRYCAFYAPKGSENDMADRTYSDPKASVQSIGLVRTGLPFILSAIVGNNGNDLIAPYAAFDVPLIVAAHDVRIAINADDAVKHVCTVISLIKGDIPFFQRICFNQPHLAFAVL